jgi:hypothetical protein
MSGRGHNENDSHKAGQRRNRKQEECEVFHKGSSQERGHYKRREYIVAMLLR